MFILKNRQPMMSPYAQSFQNERNTQSPYVNNRINNAQQQLGMSNPYQRQNIGPTPQYPTGGLYGNMFERNLVAGNNPIMQQPSVPTHDSIAEQNLQQTQFREQLRGLNNQPIPQVPAAQAVTVNPYVVNQSQNYNTSLPQQSTTMLQQLYGSNPGWFPTTQQPPVPQAQSVPPASGLGSTVSEEQAMDWMARIGALENDLKEMKEERDRLRKEREQMQKERNTQAANVLKEQESALKAREQQNKRAQELIEKTRPPEGVAQVALDPADIIRMRDEQARGPVELVNPFRPPDETQIGLEVAPPPGAVRDQGRPEDIIGQIRPAPGTAQMTLDPADIIRMRNENAVTAPVEKAIPHKTWLDAWKGALPPPVFNDYKSQFLKNASPARNPGLAEDLIRVTHPDPGTAQVALDPSDIIRMRNENAVTAPVESPENPYNRIFIRQPRDFMPEPQLPPDNGARFALDKRDIRRMDRQRRRGSNPYERPRKRRNRGRREGLGPIITRNFGGGGFF